MPASESSLASATVLQSRRACAIALAAAVCASACAAPAGAPRPPLEDTQQVTSALAYDQSAQLWTATGGVVPVCWMVGGYTQEKAWVQGSVIREWEHAANLTFTGWNDCPTSGSEPYIKLQIDAYPNPLDAYAEGVTEGIGMALLRAPGDPNHSVLFSFAPQHLAPQGRVEYVAVHTFGNVLGFIDEQDRSDAPSYCDKTFAGGPVGFLTDYDPGSIMDRCSAFFVGMQGILTPRDILGAEILYGPRCTTSLACPSSYGPQIMTVSCGGPVDFYFHDSNGSYFEETSASFSMGTSTSQGFSILACVPGYPSSCTTLSTYAPASSWCGATTCPKGTHWCGEDEGCLRACY